MSSPSGKKFPYDPLLANVEGYIADMMTGLTDLEAMVFHARISQDVAALTRMDEKLDKLLIRTLDAMRTMTSVLNQR